MRRTYTIELKKVNITFVVDDGGGIVLLFPLFSLVRNDNRAFMRSSLGKFTVPYKIRNVFGGRNTIGDELVPPI